MIRQNICSKAWAVAFAGLSVACLAGPVNMTGDVPSPSTLKLSSEFESTYEYVGGARTRLGARNYGEVSEQYSSARLVLMPQWKESLIYRLGVNWQRYSFGVPTGPALPNTLQSLAVIVGADFQVFDSWLVRVEAEPGFYGNANDLRGRDFNTPLVIGGSYIAGAELQWILGLSVDFNRRYPVIPAIGARWNFADQWTLNAVLPNPRLEYAWSKDLTFFAGGEIRDGTFRVGAPFGTAQHRTSLNDAIVEYLEVRVGAGLGWKTSQGITVEAQGGYLPYRDFDFHRAGDNLETQSGSAYGQISVGAKF